MVLLYFLSFLFQRRHKILASLTLLLILTLFLVGGLFIFKIQEDTSETTATNTTTTTTTTTTTATTITKSTTTRKTAKRCFTLEARRTSAYFQFILQIPKRYASLRKSNLSTYLGEITTFLFLFLFGSTCS